MTLSVSTSRARGCLFGQIAGDNLGALVEFRSAESIATQYPGGGPYLLADGGCWNILAGQPTDDSEMALALARMCLKVGGYNPFDAATAYIAWGGSRPFDMGGTTRAALFALERGQAPSTGTSQANGALMRVSPLGILFAGNPQGAADAAEEDAKLTHPHPVTVACNRAYAAAVAVLVSGGSTDQAFDLAYELAGRHDDERIEPVTDALDRAVNSILPADYQHQMGWVLTAFQNAFCWLMRGVRFEDAVVETVRLGGDTDTNAAIVGALLGARDGVSAIPAQWVEAIEACKPGPGTRCPRPATYWPDDAAEIADALLALSGRVKA